MSSINRKRLLELSYKLALPSQTPIVSLDPLDLLSSITQDHTNQSLDLLARRKLATSANKLQSSLSKLVHRRSSTKIVEPTIEEISTALDFLVISRGSPEVAHALVEKLYAAGGDINFLPPPKVSLTKRTFSSKKTELVPRQLLQNAVKSRQLRMITVLLPYAEQGNLDACLKISVLAGDLLATELILRAGADTNELEPEYTLVNAVKSGHFDMVHLLSRSAKPPSVDATSKALLPAATSGNLDIVMLLLALGAEYAVDNYAAFNGAVKASLVDVVAVLVLNKLPPSKLLDNAISVVSNSRSDLNQQEAYRFLELLLCAGAHGKATDECLIASVREDLIELSELLVKYGASVDFNSAKALHFAISKGNTKLVKILVDSKSGPTIAHASAGVDSAMKIEDLTTRHQIMEFLHASGATGEGVNNALILIARKKPFDQSQLEMLKLLLRMGADVNYRNGEALSKAISRANLAMVKSLLTGKPNTKTLRVAYKAALNLTAMPRLKIVPLVFDAGLPIDDEIAASMAMVVEAASPDPLLVEFFLNRGVSVSYENYRCVVSAGLALDIGIFELLLQKVPDSNSVLSSIMESIFHQKKTDIWNANGLLIMEMLLSKRKIKSDVLNRLLVLVTVIPDSVYETNQKIKFVSLFLEQGADSNYDVGLALRAAIGLGELDIVSELANHNCAASTLNFAIPYMFTSKAAIPEAFIVALLAHFYESVPGFDATLDHPELGPILFVVLEHCTGSLSILKALFKRGLLADRIVISKNDVFGSGKELITPLLWALFQSSKNVNHLLIKLLLKNHANVNGYSNISGTTPLLLATQAKNHQLVLLLISNGAKTSMKNTAERTPLWYASQGNDLEAVSILLDAGASTNDGSLHEASLCFHNDVILKLLTAGHEVDFRSHLYGGRTPLGELCYNATSTPSYHPSKSTSMESTIQTLVLYGANIEQQHLGKSLLLIALDGPVPVPATKILLGCIMQKHINDDFNLLTDKAGFTYSPTMYITNSLCKSPKKHQKELRMLLETSNCNDRFFNTNPLLPQPKDSVGQPSHIQKAEALRLAESIRIQQTKDALRTKQEAADKMAAQKLKQQMDELRANQEAADMMAAHEIKQKKTELRMQQEAADRMAAQELEMSKKMHLQELRQAEQAARLEQDALVAKQLAESEFDARRIKRLSAAAAKQRSEQLSHDTEIQTRGLAYKKSVRRLEGESIGERRLLLQQEGEQKRKMLLEEGEHRRQVETLDKGQNRRLEVQYEQQRGLVRDMERAKEGILSLAAGGGGARQRRQIGYGNGNSGRIVDIDSDDEA